MRCKSEKKMIKRNKHYCFKIFSQGSDLIQAVSTRWLGDMTDSDEKKKCKNRRRFLERLGLKVADLVTMEQIHQNRVVVVDRADRGQRIIGADGLVTKKRGVVLGVKTADCAPVIAYDPQERILGAVHSGWRGVKKKVNRDLIKKMVELGSKPNRILVGIGPTIGACCYRINQAHVYGPLRKMMFSADEELVLDLKQLVVDQLVEAGVSEANIELAEMCPACQNQEFFSFHKEGRPFGEFLTVAMLREK